MTNPEVGVLGYLGPSTGTTLPFKSLVRPPFRVVYGRDPPPLIHFWTHKAGASVIEQQLMDKDAILEELKAHLSQAQAKMKLNANMHPRDVQFDNGELVHVKLRPYRLHSLAGELKIGTQVLWPFQDHPTNLSVAYKLEPPHTAAFTQFFMCLKS